MAILIDPDGPTPIRAQFRALLAEGIADGRYQPGQRIPSERDLAVQYGISRTSVRETLTELIGEGLLFRNGRGTFVARPAERRPASGTRQVAFLISNEIFQFVQPGYDRILNGMTNACLAEGYQLVFHPVGEDAPLDETSPNAGVDGFVVTGGVRRQTLERLLRLGKPVVLVDLLVSDDRMPSLTIDYSSGVRAAIDHLVDLGHREIGFIGFPGSAKYEAFCQSLEARGLAFRPGFAHFLSLTELEPGIIAGYHGVQKLLRQSRLPTALLATNDVVALGAMDALMAAGIEVPSRMSVVGCDDLGPSTNPPLTTIRVDLDEVGRLAARTVLAQIRGEAADACTLVPVELVVRSSTAPAASHPSPEALVPLTNL